VTKTKPLLSLKRLLKIGIGILFRLKVDPLFAPLRDDARFKEMLRRLNLPE
jgi:hypothetical protein